MALRVVSNFILKGVNKMALRAKEFGVLFLILTVTLLAGNYNKGLASSVEEERALIEGAKKEGKVVFYAAGDIQLSKLYLDAFREKYPFIKTELMALKSEGLFTRVLAEARAKKLQADVIQSDATYIAIYKKEGVVSNYRSPEIQGYPDYARDPEGYWASYYDNLGVMTYNTKLVSPKEVPKKYEDLLNPVWKGHLAMDTGDARWFGYMETFWGREKNLDFCKKLAQQNITFRTGKTNLGTLLAAGEFKILVTWYLDSVERLKQMSAPLDWVFLDPVVVNGHPIFVPASAPHENAAKLYYNFLLSDKGQELVASVGKFPSKQTKNTDRILTEFYSGLKGRTINPKVVVTASGLTADKFAQHSQKFRSIFLQKR